MKKRIFKVMTIIIVLIISTLNTGALFQKDITLYYRYTDDTLTTSSYKEASELLNATLTEEDCETIGVSKRFVGTNTWGKEPSVTIYDIYNREYRIFPDEISDHVKNTEAITSAQWWLEPTFSFEPYVKMYSVTDEWYVPESQFDLYNAKELSLTPPVVLYKKDNSTIKVLDFQVDDYIATGIYKLAPWVTYSCEIFARSNCSIDQLNTILAGTNLAGYGKCFYDIEQKYGINAVVCIAIGKHESANFTSYSFRSRKNPFGLGPKMSFSSYEAAIAKLGETLNKPMYRKRGSLKGISTLYCQDGSNWYGMMMGHVKTCWSKI